MSLLALLRLPSLLQSSQISTLGKNPAKRIGQGGGYMLGSKLHSKCSENSVIIDQQCHGFYNALGDPI